MDESYVVVRVLDIVWYPVDMEESDNSLPTSVSRLGFYLTPAEMNKCSADVIENKIEELLYLHNGYRPKSFEWEYVD